MDRDRRWERVKKGYDAIVFANPKTDKDILEYIEESYKNGVTDEFIEPTAFEGYSGLNSGDGVIIANFRSDRVREIVTALGDKSFNEFETKDLDLKSSQ